MSKKKKQSEYHPYIYCDKCGKTLCKAIDLPHLDVNYCPNCGHDLTQDKKGIMRELNKRKVF